MLVNWFVFFMVFWWYAVCWVVLLDGVVGYMFIIAQFDRWKIAL